MRYCYTFIFVVISSVVFAQRPVVKVTNNGMVNVSSDELGNAVDALGLSTSYPLVIELSLSEAQYESIVGIEKREVFNSILSIHMIDVISTKTLQSFDYQLIGSARNKQSLSSELTRAIRKKKRSIQKDVNSVLKDKVSLSCDETVTAMQNISNMGNFIEAMALQQYGPGQCPQSNVAKEKIYSQYQQKNCQGHLIKVKSLIAVDDYNAAAKEIMNIDPNSNCGDEVLPLIDLLDKNNNESRIELFEAYAQYARNKDVENTDFRSQLIQILMLK